MDDFKPELLRALLDWVRDAAFLKGWSLTDVFSLGQYFRPARPSDNMEPARRRSDTLADPQRHRQRILQRIPTDLRREQRPPPKQQLDTKMAESEAHRARRIDVHTGGM